MKRIAFSAVFAALMGVAGVVNANSPEILVGGEPLTLKHTGAFADFVNFHLDADSMVSSVLFNVLSVENYQAALWAGEYYEPDDADVDGPIVKTDGALSYFTQDGDTYGLKSISLTKGDYHVQVLGTAGDQGGSYSISLAPVPEPESYAMLLAGLGLTGMIARRRSRAKAV